MISSVSLVTQTMNDITKSIAQILKVRASYPKQGINPFEWTTFELISKAISDYT